MEQKHYITIEKELYDALEKEAVELGCTVEELVNRILREYFEERDRKRKRTEELSETISRSET